MTLSDRWVHVEQLYHDTLARDPGERAAFLRDECGGDQALQGEVESLLAYAVNAQVFLDAPVMQVVATSIDAPQIDQPLVGRCLGPYEIRSLLGAGGMGEVYCAHDTKLGRDVAFKVLPWELAGDPERRASLLREARAAASLNHPNICTIHDVGETDGQVYIAMEMVEGTSLSVRVAAGPLPADEVVRYGRQLADALAHAHDRGVVHRDLKSANVMVTPERRVKVLDFGLAKRLSAEELAEVATVEHLSMTQPSAILGTLPYMAPEQLRGQPADARSDMWALGIVLYEMTAGVRPFNGHSGVELRSAILHDGLPPLPSRVAAPLEAVIRRCVEKEPARRYQRARDVRAALETVERHASTRVTPWPVNGRHPRALIATVSLAAVLGLTGAAALLVRPTRTGKQELTYTQLTNFTDSAVSPAVSPDGKMLAFIRSDNWFLTPDQIYVKRLPDGEPVQLTHDSRLKYGPTFSPDGSRILYTVYPWSTYAVSPQGGEPTLLLTNSSGITWLDRRRILFSEANPPSSTHMGLVTAMEDRSEQRTIYFPREERGMVHLSYASPDRQWVLVLEMNPVWQPCRVVPLDGRSAGRQVGPKGKCTSAAWSPDGKWMYFGVEVDGHHHLWRQPFPDGQTEQITAGPTEEDGMAVAADGRSLITSIGMQQSAVWIHDARGDRPLSSQGYVPHPVSNGMSGTLPVFLRDGKWLFYLKSESPEAPTELWRMDAASEKSEKALPGISMLEFDVSDDGKEVVYSAHPPGKPLQIWVAPLDRRSPPQLISASGEDSPHFGPDGRVVYRLFDGTNHYLAQMNRDGSGRSNLVPYPIGSIYFMSPDRRWITAIMTPPGGGRGGTLAVPLGGGAPQRICSGCPVVWAPDGKFLYLFVQRPSLADRGKTLVIPLPPGEMLPKLPPFGMRAPAAPDDPKLFPGSYLIGIYGISPSPDPSVYAYVKTTMHRNLFRIPLR